MPVGAGIYGMRGGVLYNSPAIGASLSRIYNTYYNDGSSASATLLLESPNVCELRSAIVYVKTNNV